MRRPETMDSRQCVEVGSESSGAWVLDPAACTLCGRCVEACPEAVVVLEGARLVLARPENCTYCGLCEDLCPEGAIALAYAIVWGDASDQA
jgi:NAD-dependent dihydropyrimidine dehydrogenase PreA subunit